MKFSIVTAAFNAACTLADTLESVARQSYSQIEHWLIDGGSSDGTLTVARRHGTHLAGIVSERDRGLYDAMNKGARKANGEIIAFLNADDWYAGPDVLTRIAQLFTEGADVVYGDLAFVEPDAPYRVRRIWRDEPHVPRDFFDRGWCPAHPATFIRKSLFDYAGPFDLRWSIAGDYVLLSRVMAMNDVRIRHLPVRVVNMRLGGRSTAGVSAVWQANTECVLGLREGGHRRPWLIVSKKVARKLPQLWAARRLPYDEEAAWRPWDAEPPPQG